MLIFSNILLCWEVQGGFPRWSSEDEILWRLALKSICSGFDLDYCAKTKDIHVWCPEELLVVARICQLLLDFIQWVGDTSHHCLSISWLKLLYKSLVIEYRVLEYLFYIFLRDFRRWFTWWSQMLSSIYCEVNLGIAKVFWFVVREE